MGPWWLYDEVQRLTKTVVQACVSECKPGASVAAKHLWQEWPPQPTRPFVPVLVKISNSPSPSFHLISFGSGQWPSIRHATTCELATANSRREHAYHLHCSRWDAVCSQQSGALRKRSGGQLHGRGGAHVGGTACRPRLLLRRGIAHLCPGTFVCIGLQDPWCKY